MKTEKVIRTYKGKSSIIYPPEEIKRIVAEIESGQLQIPEAMEKYQIRTRHTIRDWFRRYGTTSSIPTPSNRLSVFEKRQIVIEVESGKLTFNESLRVHGISYGALKLWLKQYSSEIHGSEKPDEMDKEKLAIPATEKKAIDQLKLRIAALETMIDVAERELGIEIRKKSGTKQ